MYYASPTRFVLSLSRSAKIAVIGASESRKTTTNTIICHLIVTLPICSRAKYKEVLPNTEATATNSLAQTIESLTVVESILSIVTFLQPKLSLIKRMDNFNAKKKLERDSLVPAKPFHPQGVDNSELFTYAPDLNLNIENR